MNEETKAILIKIASAAAGAALAYGAIALGIKLFKKTPPVVE